MPHVIRLRGPWNYEPLARFVTLPDGSAGTTNTELPPAGVIELPADWGIVLGADFQGRVRFTRRFGCPTGLDSTSCVWLVIDDVDWQAEVSLNDHSLGTAVCSQSVDSQSALKCPARFNVTSHLSPQNRLSIVVTSPILNADYVRVPRRDRIGQPGGLNGLVRLEID
jgi:hypothetical protein